MVHRFAVLLSQGVNLKTMKHDFKTYLILSGVFLLSVAGSYLVPAEELLKSVMAAPGVVALLAALYQLSRDQAAYEKKLEMQQKQFQFTIGAASHMANIAFSKHVEFCEEYMTEIQKAFDTMFKKGEASEALEHAEALYKVRERHALWLTETINSELEKFEGAMRRMGADAYFVEATRGDGRHTEQRALRSNSSFDLLHEIMGWDSSREINQDYAISSVRKKVTNVLGVEELTDLRNHLVHEASKTLKQLT